MNKAIALSFRDQFRSARSVALRDAEAFEPAVHLLERLGVYLLGSIGDLGKYEASISAVARESPLAGDIALRHPAWHSTFAQLFELVRTARNHAVHEGAFARHLTVHALELCLILEDALMTDATTARDFMLASPICAAMWQPVSSVRTAMLTSAFSYLPVNVAGDTAPTWKLISDVELAKYLRAARTTSERLERLAKKLGEAVEDGGLVLLDAQQCGPEAGVDEVLIKSHDRPVLVVGDQGELRGIVTAFDVL